MDKDMELKLIYVGVVAVVLLLLVILISSFGTSGNAPNNTTPTQPVTKALSTLYLSEYDSNLQLSNISAVDAITPISIPTYLSVYKGQSIGSQVFVDGKLGLVSENGIYASNTYYLVTDSANNNYTLTYKGRTVNGSISGDQAIADLKSFIQSSLALNLQQYVFTASKVQNAYTVSAQMYINGYPVFTTTDASFSATVSTSGQVLSITINDFPAGQVKLDDYPLLTREQLRSDIEENQEVGEFAPDLPDYNNSATSIAPISYSITSSQVGYFYDSPTGYLYPVDYVKVSFVSNQDGKSYTCVIVAPLIQTSLMVFQPATPTP